jgi:hypothetical protein
MGMPHDPLDIIIEVFTLSNFDAFFLIDVVLFDAGAIGAAFIAFFIKLGLPLDSMVLIRKRKAFFLSRLAVSRKSMVLPCFLAAR